MLSGRENLVLTTALVEFETNHHCAVGAISEGVARAGRLACRRQVADGCWPAETSFGAAFRRRERWNAVGPPIYAPR